MFDCTTDTLLHCFSISWLFHVQTVNNIHSRNVHFQVIDVKRWYFLGNLLTVKFFFTMSTKFKYCTYHFEIASLILNVKNIIIGYIFYSR